MFVYFGMPALFQGSRAVVYEATPDHTRHEGASSPFGFHPSRIKDIMLISDS